MDRLQSKSVESAFSIVVSELFHVKYIVKINNPEAVKQTVRRNIIQVMATVFCSLVVAGFRVGEMYQQNNSATIRVKESQSQSCMFMFLKTNYLI